MTMKKRRIRRILRRAGLVEAQLGQAGWTFRSHYGQLEVSYEHGLSGFVERVEFERAQFRRELALERAQSALVARGITAQARSGFVTLDDLGTVAITIG